MRSLLLVLVLLLASSGCSTMQSFGSNVGACGAEIGIGVGAGLAVAVLGTNEILGDSASTGARAAVAGGGALAGAAIGYTACVAANRHRRAVEERFAELEARLAEQDPASPVINAGAAGAPKAEVRVEQVTYTVTVVDRSATKVELGGLLFEPASDELSERGRLYLQIYAETLAPDMAVIVQGHTDDTGSEQTNLALSQRRADAVRGVLLGAGVSAARVEAVGYGESQPIPGATRDENRRVELWMIPQQAQTSS